MLSSGRASPIAANVRRFVRPTETAGIVAPSSGRRKLARPAAECRLHRRLAYPASDWRTRRRTSWPAEERAGTLLEGPARRTGGIAMLRLMLVLTVLAVSAAPVAAQTALQKCRAIIDDANERLKCFEAIEEAPATAPAPPAATPKQAPAA